MRKYDPTIIESYTAGASINRGDVVYLNGSVVFPVTNGYNEHYHVIGQCMNNATYGGEARVIRYSIIRTTTDSAWRLSGGEPVYAKSSTTVWSGTWGDTPIGRAVNATFGDVPGEFVYVAPAVVHGIWNGGTIFEAGSNIYAGDMVTLANGSVLYPLKDSNTSQLYGIAAGSIQAGTTGGTVIVRGIFDMPIAGPVTFVKNDKVYAASSNTVDSGTTGDMAIGVCAETSTGGNVFVKLMSSLFYDSYVKP